MIKIGLTDDQKQAEIAKYREEHPEVEHVIIFVPEALPLISEYESYTWSDIIMYKVFYPLLERIDSSYLIVTSELMRTKNRNDLTYNCLHHYLNQTPHRLHFHWFPMIDGIEDVLILADMDYPGRYKGQGISKAILRELEMTGVDRRPSIEIISVDVPDNALDAYERERDKLFDNLGAKDPDTIPRKLHLWTGKYKKPMISTEKRYLARNSRFKLDNVMTYKDATDADRISIDLPLRRMVLNDYLTRVQADTIRFLTTPFKVDQYYAGELLRWHKMAGEIYAETGIL